MALSQSHPKYRGSTYRHFYTLGNTPAIIHIQPCPCGGASPQHYAAGVDLGDGVIRLLTGPQRDDDGVAVPLAWSEPTKLLDLCQPDWFGAPGGIDAAIAQAERQWAEELT